MKKATLVIAFSFFTCYRIVAQNEVTLTLSSDYLDAYEYYIDPLKISSNQNVLTTGIYITESTIRIKPEANYNIVIKPLDTSSNLFRDILEGGTTVIKAKPPGGGRLPSIIIYPNPVQTDLNYTISNSLVTSYSIYNIMGILQTSQTVNPPVSTGTINVSSLTNGNYILILNIVNGQQASIQFIKN